jgi:hypothetical protein
MLINRLGLLGKLLACSLVLFVTATSFRSSSKFIGEYTTKVSKLRALVDWNLYRIRYPEGQTLSIRSDGTFVFVNPCFNTDYGTWEAEDNVVRLHVLKRTIRTSLQMNDSMRQAFEKVDIPDGILYKHGDALRTKNSNASAGTYDIQYVRLK